jgi:hypothetical protein
VSATGVGSAQRTLRKATTCRVRCADQQPRRQRSGRDYDQDRHGKPVALKHKLSGLWSRSIDDENRLVYRFIDGELAIVRCLYH